jgi:hypothetical protein
MSISFEPSPNYAAMTVEASGGFGVSGLFTRKVNSVGDFEAVLEEAVTAVKDKKGAFVEAVMVRRE